MRGRPAIGRAAASRRAAVFILLALLWQACLVQTHFHPDPMRSLSAGVGARGQTHQPPVAVAPPVCPLCEEQALFGTYVAAGPVALAPPSAAASWYAPPSLDVADRRASSHAWRSRAPPARSSLSIT